MKITICLAALTMLILGAQSVNASIVVPEEQTPTYDVETSNWSVDQEGESPVSAIPEPGTYAVIAGVLALGLAAWRRRK